MSYKSLLIYRCSLFSLFFSLFVLQFICRRNQIVCPAAFPTVWNLLTVSSDTGFSVPHLFYTLVVRFRGLIRFRSEFLTSLLCVMLCVSIMRRRMSGCLSLCVSGWWALPRFIESLGVSECGVLILSSLPHLLAKSTSMKRNFALFIFVYPEVHFWQERWDKGLMSFSLLTSF